MRPSVRKSAPGVRGGKTQKKNRTALSPDIYEHEFQRLVVQRIRPAKGHYHAVMPTDVRRFVAIVPDWEEVFAGIKAVVLTPGDDYCYGRYNNAGVVTLDAWPKEGFAYDGPWKAWLLERWKPSKAPVRSEVESNSAGSRCGVFS